MHTQAQEHEYDIIGHPQLNFSFVVVFPFHPYTDGRPGGEASRIIQREHPWLSAVSSLIAAAAEYKVGLYWRAEGSVVAKLASELFCCTTR